MLRNNKFKIVKTFLTTSSVLTLLAVSSVPAYAIKDEELNNGKNRLKATQQAAKSTNSLFNDINNGKNVLKKVEPKEQEKAETNTSTEATQTKNNLRKTSASETSNIQPKKPFLAGIENFGSKVLKAAKSGAQLKELEQQKAREQNNSNPEKLQEALDQIKNSKAIEEEKKIENKRKEQRTSLENNKRAQAVADKKQQEQEEKEKQQKAARIAAASDKRVKVAATGPITEEEQQAQRKQLFAAISNGSSTLNKVDQEAVKTENEEKKAEIIASKDNGRTNMLSDLNNPDNIKKLKPVNNASPASSADAPPPPPGGTAPTGDSKNKTASAGDRQNLLSEIQAGKQLKNAAARKLNEKAEPEVNSFAKALNNRRGAIDGSNDDDDGKKALKAEQQKLYEEQDKLRSEAEQKRQQEANTALEKARVEESNAIMNKLKNKKDEAVKDVGDRDDLLSAIRKGKTLKKVGINAEEKKPVENDALFGAAMADQMKKRQAEAEATQKAEAKAKGVAEQNNDDWGDDGWDDQPTPTPVAVENKTVEIPKVIATLEAETRDSKKGITKEKISVPAVEIPVTNNVDNSVPPPPPPINGLAGLPPSDGPAVANSIINNADSSVPPPPVTNIAPPSDNNGSSFVPMAPVGSPPGDKPVAVTPATKASMPGAIEINVTPKTGSSITEEKTTANTVTSIINPAPAIIAPVTAAEPAKVVANPAAVTSTAPVVTIQPETKVITPSPNRNRPLPTPPVSRKSTVVTNIAAPQIGSEVNTNISFPKMTEVAADVTKINSVDKINNVNQQIANNALTQKEKEAKALQDLEKNNSTTTVPTNNVSEVSSSTTPDVTTTSNSSKRLRITNELAALKGSVAKIQKMHEDREKTEKETEDKAKQEAEERAKTATPLATSTPPPKPVRDHTVASSTTSTISTPVTTATTTISTTSGSTVLPTLPPRNGTAPTLPPRSGTVVSSTTPAVPVVTTAPVPGGGTSIPVVTPVTPGSTTIPVSTPVVTTAPVPGSTTIAPGTSSASAIPTLAAPGAGPAVTSRPAAPTAFDIDLTRAVVARGSTASASETTSVDINSSAVQTEELEQSTDSSVLQQQITAEINRRAAAHEAEQDQIAEQEIVEEVTETVAQPEVTVTQVSTTSPANISTAIPAAAPISVANAESEQQNQEANIEVASIEPTSGGGAGGPPPEKQVQEKIAQTVKEQGIGKLAPNFTNVAKEANKAHGAALLNRTDYLELNLNLNNAVSAPAAGDEASEVVFGTWISGLYGASKKASAGNEAGYNGKLAGGSVGLDFEIRDNTILGISYSYVDSTFKYKGSKSGDKVNARSNIGAVYGISQLSNNIVWRGIFSASFSKIKNARVEHSANNKVASAKLSSKNYSIDNNIGYRCDLGNDMSLTPNATVRYSYYNNGAYNETGTDKYNLSIAKANSSDLTGAIGVKLSTINQLDNGTKIIPTINIAVERLLNRKQQKVKAKLNWTNDYFEGKVASNKLDLTTINLGSNIVARKDNLEFSAGCNYNFSPNMKSQNYQGFAKIKIKL